MFDRGWNIGKRLVNGIIGRKPKRMMTARGYYDFYRSTYSPLIYPIHESEVVIEAPPTACDGTGDSWRFRMFEKRQSSPSFVAQFADAEVHRPNGEIVTNDGVLISDLSRRFGANPYGVSRGIWSSKSRHIQGTMAVLATDGGSSYYHWMVDILPRIHLLKEAGLFDKIETFVLPPMNSDFQRETLHLLKLPAEKMIFADSRDFAVTADHVFVPSLPSRLGVIEAWTCMYLQEAFSEWRAQDGASPRKIYISRDDAPIRRVTAAAQFKARLLEAGYTEILCSEHSVEEQIKLFANATHVVAPHGGGLTNILFCEPGTKVLDIFPSSFVIPCYWSLSNRVGLRYHCYSDGPVENAFSPYWVNEDRNISIDDRFWPLFYEFDKSG